jgi:hypothetical protein
MYWLLQRGFQNDPRHVEMCENLIRLNIPHSFCDVIPFTSDISFEDADHFRKHVEELGMSVFVYGSYSLSKIACKNGWVPGAFIDNLSLDYLNENYGKEMLNYDSVFCRLGDAIDVPERFFCKPMEDTKSFVAEVVSRGKFLEWREKIVGLSGEFSTVNVDTMIVISSVKKMLAEIRFFVVGGKISTYSQYRCGDEIVYSSDVDEFVIEYVERLLREYKIVSDAFVIDIALTDSGCKIVECNTINSSGLYHIDTQKFIMDIEELGEKY